MLEKVGLPAKPSLRGNTWVVDASHCQGCSSQFTFINRKHHCRRCGGLFCGSCTQHRMVLRGQGDSPVRICEPCKKMEEAARFELRHGNRSKAGKGSSKVASRDVDDVLNQLMANDSKYSNHTGFGKEISSQNEDEVLSGSSSNGFDMGSITPEELRQQSVDEKNRFKILKGEGKSAEALKAYKRSKELERQAAALELQLRKNRKKALASGSASSSMAERQKSGDVSLESSIKVKPGNQKVKEKDDLTAELKELGWSDVDINDVDKKPAVTSLEGELLNLIGKDSRKDGSSKVSSGLDKSQVVAMKKKALALKREGKLAEAKEELKRAKILEKQLEEQELLADAEDSDDELSALIRSMDEHDDKQNDFSVGFDLGSGFDFDLSKIGGDFNLDGNFEVTDDDLHDPEMAAALQSLGWDEDPMELDGKAPDSATVDGETIEAEILSLKKEAVTQKRAGNMAEAMSLLKKAKALEKDLDSSGSGNIENAPGSDGVSTRTTADTVLTKTNLKPAPKSRLMIQKELLTVKKKALALRREGKLDEADEELKKGKVLEQQLEEIDNNASKMENLPFDLSSDVTPDDKEDEGDVITDQDLHNPTYLSLLKNLGWQEEDNNTKATIPSSEPSVGNPDTSSVSTFTVKKLRRSKAEIQRELLGLKRKALALRRQGQETEAEELLVSAKALEEEMAEMEASKVEVFPNFSDQKLEFESNNPIEGVTQTPLKRPSESNNDDPEKRQVVNASTHELTPSPSVSPENQRIPLQQEILAHKRKALALKREGKMAEARAELRKAKVLERNLEENKPNNNNVTSISMDVTSSSPSSTSTPQEKKKPANSSPSKPMSSSERFKLQRECLNHKRNALKLRREGKTEEADSELEIAKKLEAQLEEASPQDSSSSTSSEAGLVEDSGVEDFLDPQLLSALKSIGLQDVAMVQQTPVKPETRAPSSTNKSDSSTQEERTQLEAQIKAEKVKALNLKRAGKQAEALDALRRAKQMEKKLNSMAM